MNDIPGVPGAPGHGSLQSFLLGQSSSATAEQIARFSPKTELSAANCGADR